jgi:integrase
MKITAILKGKEDKQGRYPVVIRINDKHKRIFKTTKIKVREDQWEKGKIVKHPQSVILNDIIKKELAKYELSEMKDMQRVVKIDLFDYWDQCLELWSATKAKKPPTIRQYKYEKSKLERFRTSQILAEIDNKFFVDLLKFCYEKEGNQENTAWKTFSRVHAVLEQAVSEGLLPQNPMDKFKDRPKYRDPKKEFLTKEQLDKIEDFALTDKSKARRDFETEPRRFATFWFLIGCYTGLRYSDMITFNKKKDIHNGRLIKENIKTGEIVSLPFRGKIKELFERVEYKPLDIENQPYNRILKVIAEKCEIHINLTAHTSRHTAAMLLANNKVDIHTTAKILGHKDIRHTQIYYKIANSTIDDAMDKIIKL